VGLDPESVRLERERQGAEQRLVVLDNDDAGVVFDVQGLRPSGRRLG